MNKKYKRFKQTKKIKRLYSDYVKKSKNWNDNYSFSAYGFDNIRLEPCEIREFISDYYNSYRNNFYRIYGNEYDLIAHISSNLTLNELTEEIDDIMRNI